MAAKAKKKAAAREAKPEAVPRDISGQAIAAACELSDRRVQQLAAEGVLQRTGHGRYKFAGFAAAIAKSQVDGEIARRQPSNPVAAADFESERTRKLKLENDENEGLLIRTDAAMALVDWIFGAMETALSGVPAQFTEDVHERRRLEHVMDTVRGGLAADYRKARAAALTSGDPLDTTAADNAG
jgi:hypothetical protein